MNKLIILVVTIIFVSGCQNEKKTEVENQSGIHEVIVQEVLQVSEYTYLKVLEGENEKWLASPSVQVEKGKTYYFKNGMEMTNFESKELGKTFEKIYFIDMLSADPDLSKKIMTREVSKPNALSHQATKPKIIKEKVQIEPIKGIVSIASLYEDTKKYEGKRIRIKGKVTKYNPAILKRNWVHLQDGTAYKGKFDFTATIINEVKVGDVIIIEGIISIDKDFGYGYVYELIMENANLIN